MIFRTLKTAAAALALAPALLAASPASAADLFRTATPADGEAAGAGAPVGPAVRERMVALNDGALDAEAELTIRLFPDAAATFRKTSSEPASGGGDVWQGEAGTTGVATLVFARGKVTGQVELRGRTYKITGSGGAQRVIEIDPSRLPPEGPITTPKTLPERKTDAVPQAPATGKTRIRVLVAYTDAAAAASSDIIADANLAIADANQAYATSGVKIKLTLAGTIAVSGYSEASTSWNNTLDNLTGSSGAPNPAPFAATRARRDSASADLVVLLRSGGSEPYCGLGWYIEEPSSSTSGYGFSETDVGCITNRSVAHEMGHNMGLDHDRYVTATAPKSKYNFGFVLLGKKVRSIMAYNNQCADAGVYCDRLNRFSTPDDTVSGKPFGIEKGKKGAADASRRLNETRAGIASYR